MSRILTALSKLNLAQISTIRLRDTHPNSRLFKVFGIKNEDYGLGRHSFMIYGTKYLMNNSDIAIEILDDDEQPIIVRGIQTVTTEPGWRVWFHVRKDHSPGIGTIYIAGSAFLEEFGLKTGQRRAGQYNVLWQRDISINPALPNRSPIVFMDTPRLQVSSDTSETIGVQDESVGFAHFQLYDLEPYSGQVAKVDIYGKNESIKTGSYQLITSYPLISSSFTKNGVNPDSTNFTHEVSLTHNPTVYSFKANFKNAIDEPAKTTGGEQLEIEASGGTVSFTPSTSTLNINTAGSLSFQVSEIIAAGDTSGQTWQPSSIAQLDISDVNISDGMVTGIAVDKHKSTDIVSASRWNPCGIFNTPSWTTGSSYSITSSIGGIETMPPSDGGINWDFRIGFVNSSNALATLLPVVTGSSGSVSSSIFTFVFDPNINENDLVGRIAAFSSSNQSQSDVFDFESPHEYYYISSNSGSTITLQSLQQSGNSPTNNANTYIYLDSYRVYDIQTNFNGFDDLGETIEVDTLKAYINDAWITGASGSILSKSKVQLLWTNMYSSSTAAATGADGNVHSNLTPTKWKNINKYRVYMWVADEGQLEPEYQYPSLTDSNGTWYLAEEIPSPKSITPSEISASIDSLPVNIYLSFWVGSITNYTVSIGDRAPYGHGLDRMVI